MSDLNIYQITPDDISRWQATMEIYYTAFPEWEREPEDVLIKRISSGRYVMYCGQEQDNVVGFYILDINQEPSYALFSFLAVSESQRGKGLGTILCKDAIRRFHEEYSLNLLLIEAEDRQALFYGKLGFKKIDIDYLVPKYNAPGSVPMHLMAISVDNHAPHLEAKQLRALIEHIFTTGYYLNDQDERLTAQLANIPELAALLVWPPKD